MVTFGFFCLNAPITCSLNGCWNVDPEPFRVAEPPCVGALAAATAAPEVTRPVTRTTGTSHRRLGMMRFIRVMSSLESSRGGRYEAMLARLWRSGSRTVNTAGTIGAGGAHLDRQSSPRRRDVSAMLEAV